MHFIIWSKCSPFSFLFLVWTFCHLVAQSLIAVRWQNKNTGTYTEKHTKEIVIVLSWMGKEWYLCGEVYIERNEMNEWMNEWTTGRTAGEDGVHRWIVREGTWTSAAVEEKFGAKTRIYDDLVISGEFQTQMCARRFPNCNSNSSSSAQPVGEYQWTGHTRRAAVS